MQPQQKHKYAGILVIILILSIAALIVANQPHKSAYNDPIYKGQLEAEKMLREDRAVLVKIVP
jgi:hypothetical protein